jgi:hypothetical protein
LLHYTDAQTVAKLDALFEATPAAGFVPLASIGLSETFD